MKAAARFLVRQARTGVVRRCEEFAVLSICRISRRKRHRAVSPGRPAKPSHRGAEGVGSYRCLRRPGDGRSQVRTACVEPSAPQRGSASVSVERRVPARSASLRSSGVFPLPVSANPGIPKGGCGHVWSRSVPSLSFRLFKGGSASGKGSAITSRPVQFSFRLCFSLSLFQGAS